MISGILCIDKPADHTSFDVIARVRGILGQRKAGHGGTLDPMATGVLPVFLGHATRCCDILPVERKRYIAEARLGTETDTQDCTGKILRTTDAAVGREALEAAIASFGGGYDQLPPMYSAIQVGGQRLYDLARQGIEVERKTRPVLLHKLKLLDFNEEAQTFILEAECSRGTYIRTLCCDIAGRAGSCCMLTGLRRTMSAGFSIEECITIEELTELARQGRAKEAVLPVERAFKELPRAYLTPQQARMFKNGVKMDLARIKIQAESGMVAVWGWEEGFLATAVIDKENGILSGVKLFCDRD